MERREFLRKGGRILLLGGMVAGSAYLIASGKVQKQGSCKIASTCGGCSKLTACNKEQTTLFRKDYK